MTALKDAAIRQALEALLTYEQYIQPLTAYFGGPRVPEEGSASAKVNAAITALRAALAEPVQQWQSTPNMVQLEKVPAKGGLLPIDAPPQHTAEPLEPVATLYGTLPVYDTAPPQRPAEPVQEAVAWHHPECEGECIACLIEGSVRAEYGLQGLNYLRRHINAAHGIKEET